jgi:hypothetical protein
LDTKAKLHLRIFGFSPSQWQGRYPKSEQQSPGNIILQAMMEQATTDLWKSHHKIDEKQSSNPTDEFYPVHDSKEDW